MKLDETIVAISTAIGISAISIVRLCGKNALNIAKILTKSQDLSPRFAYLKYIYDCKNRVIERGIVLYFQAPNSFNGEDIIEFQIHGGIISPKLIVEECIKNGARLANPGEFSKIAFLNNKLDLIQIEQISQLINAQSAQALEIINHNIKGELQHFILNLRENILWILSSIEVLIDYSQEDLPKDLEIEIKNKLESAIQKIKEILNHSLSLQNAISGHKLAIIGSPNVGKSSILNRLLLKERAIVSEISGTTRDIISENIIIENQIINIIDTAGIRECSDKIEQIGIKKSKEILDIASIILAVFDGTQRTFDSSLIDLLNAQKTALKIIVINKNDLDLKLDIDSLKARLEGDFELIFISSFNDSIFCLRNLIASKIRINPLNDESIILSTTRQIECLKKCALELESAYKNLAILEIFALHLNYALKSLDLLSSPFCANEILDKMFGEFCLGK